MSELGLVGDTLLFKNIHQTGREAQHIKIHSRLSGGDSPARRVRPSTECGQANAGCAHMPTARATCPDADQALDPLRDVGTGKLIDALRTLSSRSAHAAGCIG